MPRKRRETKRNLTEYDTRFRVQRAYIIITCWRWSLGVTEAARLDPRFAPTPRFSKRL